MSDNLQTLCMLSTLILSVCIASASLDTVPPPRRSTRHASASGAGRAHASRQTTTLRGKHSGDTEQISAFYTHPTTLSARKCHLLSPSAPTHRVGPVAPRVDATWIAAAADSARQAQMTSLERDQTHAFVLALSTALSSSAAPGVSASSAPWTASAQMHLGRRCR